MSKTVETNLVICNQKGLHARAAAAFVKCVAETDAEVKVEKDGQQVDGNSILSLMMLAASKGTSIKITASARQIKSIVSSDHTKSTTPNATQRMADTIISAFIFFNVSLAALILLSLVGAVG